MDPIEDVFLIEHVFFVFFVSFVRDLFVDFSSDPFKLL